MPPNSPLLDKQYIKLAKSVRKIIKAEAYKNFIWLYTL